jgi:hypothetical protein
LVSRIVVVLFTAVVATVAGCGGTSPGGPGGPGSGTPSLVVAPSASAADIVSGSVPNSFDAEAAAALGLADGGEPNELYAVVWSMYRQVFSAFLLEQLDIAGYDAELKNSSLGFTPVPGGDASFYQANSYLGLAYVYLRNNTNVERLSREDVEAFSSRAGGDNLGSDPVLREIVERTYPRVGRIVDSDEVDLSGYDMSGAKNCENDAVAFEVSYAVEFNADGSMADAEAQSAKSAYLEELATRMATSLTAELGHSVAVFVEPSLG